MSKPVAEVLSVRVATVVLSSILAVGCALEPAPPAASHWVATESHGCKPGVAWEVWTEGGVPQQGNVCVLDPRIWDGEASIRGVVRLVAPMSRIVQEGPVVRFWLPENSARIPASGHFVLGEALAGAVGTLVPATVSLDADETTTAPLRQSSHDVTFERVD